ncbi:hypothetical protein FKP32DRAFT_1540080, partial [Trametes sanguinea]
MIKPAKKYGVRMHPSLPSEALRLAMPIWHHLASPAERLLTNSVAMKCLRRNHEVTLAGQARRVAQRLTFSLNDAPHVGGAACRCSECCRDRARGCDNPHRCVLAAQRLINQLPPLWNTEGSPCGDGLSLTPGRKRQNDSASAAGEGVLFDPTVRTTLPLTTAFRVFV